MAHRGKGSTRATTGPKIVTTSRRTSFRYFSLDDPIVASNSGDQRLPSHDTSARRRVQSNTTKSRYSNATKRKSRNSKNELRRDNGKSSSKTRRGIPQRKCEAFSTSSNRGVKPKGPPKANPWQPLKRVEPTHFSLFYRRGDLPVSVGHGAKRKVIWKEDITCLDYSLWLRETREPCKFIAQAGLLDLLQHGENRVLPVIPQLILPIKEALNTRNKNVIRVTINSLQALLRTTPLAGECLVPYYRQLLPTFNLILLLEHSCKLEFDSSGRKLENLVDIVNATLELLESTGGPDAFLNIKYMVPTYERCII